MYSVLAITYPISFFVHIYQNLSGLFISLLLSFLSSFACSIFLTVELTAIFFWGSAVKKICDIYDWDGKGELDLYFLGDVMYALGMNTTKKVVKI